MLYLETLGRIAVERKGSTPLSAAPRRRLLALLALIAGHDPAGISRDKLLAYLWPESDTRRARNSLKQALSSLRQSFGIPLVQSAGGMLRLDRSLIQVDLWQFEEALAWADDAAAVRVYRGPFLNDLELSGLEEFDRWMKTERERLACRHDDALRNLAQRADALGASLAAVPTHTAWSGSGLGGPAGDAFVGFADRPRDDPGLPQLTALAPLQSRPDAPLLRAGRLATQAVPWRPTWWVPPVPWLVWLAVAVLWAVAFLLKALTAPTNVRHAAGAVPAEPTTVAVAPFAVVGSPESAELGRGLEELLEAKLDGLDGLRTIAAAPGASRISDARLYVRGQLVVGDGGLTARATLYDRGNANSAVGWAEAEVEGKALFDLADALTAQLIAERYRGPHERLTKVAVASTRSLPALKAYLSGERRFQADSFPAAIDAFRQAVRADTAFALAYYRLSLAADWEERRATALWAARLAARFSDRLSERDRLLVEAYLVRRLGNLDESERLYRNIVADYPEDSEAWSQLADLLFRTNPLRGRSAAEARQAFEQVLALEPDNKEALVHLARIATLDGDQEAADSLIRRTVRLTGDSAVLGLRAFRAFALGDRPGRHEATRELMAEPGFVPSAVALQAAVLVDDLAGSERFAELLTSKPRSCELQALGGRMLAQVQLARGLPASARARLSSPAACDSGASLELRTVYDALPFVPVGRKELKAVWRELQAWNPYSVTTGEKNRDLTPAHLRLYGLGLIALQAGDSAVAARAALSLTRASDPTPAGELAWSLSRSLRARLALQRGHRGQALSYLEHARWERSADGSVAEPSDRFLRAELLRRLGRLDEAIGWYGSIAERSSYELVYLAPAQFRLGQIYDERRDVEQAIDHYRRFRELWRDPEPELQPMVKLADWRLKSLAGRGR